MGMDPLQLYRDRRRARIKAGLACAAAIFALTFIVVGCGGESSEVDTTAPAATEQPVSTTEQTASMSGSELGEAVAATWVEAMQELVALLADKPEPADVQAEVEQLKEGYIQKMVEYGRQKAELDAAEQAQVNAEIATMFGVSDEDWYESYSDIYVYYAASDIEFSNLVADFNILTQYADFELLKQQAPEEAARLGIE